MFSPSFTPNGTLPINLIDLSPLLQSINPNNSLSSSHSDNHLIIKQQQEWDDQSTNQPIEQIPGFDNRTFDQTITGTYDQSIHQQNDQFDDFRFSPSSTSSVSTEESISQSINHAINESFQQPNIHIIAQSNRHLNNQSINHSNECNNCKCCHLARKRLISNRSIKQKLIATNQLVLINQSINQQLDEARKEIDRLNDLLSHQPITHATNQSRHTSKPLISRLVSQSSKQAITLGDSPVKRSNESINQSTNQSQEIIELRSQIEAHSQTIKHLNQTVTQSNLRIATEKSINQQLRASISELKDESINRSVNQSRLQKLEEENQSLINQLKSVGPSNRLMDYARSVHQSNNQSINQSNNQSNKQSNNQSISQVIDDVINQSINLSIEQSIDDELVDWEDDSSSVCPPADESVNQTTNQSISQSVNQSISQNTEESLEISISVPASQSILSTLSIDQPINELNNHSVNRSINRSVNQSINQPINQSVGQSTGNQASAPLLVAKEAILKLRAALSEKDRIIEQLNRTIKQTMKQVNKQSKKQTKQSNKRSNNQSNNITPSDDDDQPLSEAVNQSINQSNNNSTATFTSNPVGRAIKKVTRRSKQSNNQTNIQPISQPTRRSTRQSSKQANTQSVSQSTSQATTQSINPDDDDDMADFVASLEQSFSQVFDQSIEQPNDQTDNQQDDQFVDMDLWDLDNVDQSNDRFDSQPINRSISQSIEHSSSESTTIIVSKEPVQESIKQSTDDFVEMDDSQLTQSFNHNINQPAVGSSSGHQINTLDIHPNIHSSNQTNNRTIHQSNNQSVTESVRRSSRRKSNRTGGLPIGESLVAQPASQMVVESNRSQTTRKRKRTDDESIHVSTDQPINQSIDQPVDQSISPLKNKPAKKIKQSITHQDTPKTNKSPRKATIQAVKPAIKQPIKQSAKQTIKQSIEDMLAEAISADPNLILPPALRTTNHSHGIDATPSIAQSAQTTVSVPASSQLRDHLINSPLAHSVEQSNQSNQSTNRTVKQTAQIASSQSITAAIDQSAPHKSSKRTSKRTKKPAVINEHVDEPNNQSTSTDITTEQYVNQFVEQSINLAQSNQQSTPLKRRASARAQSDSKSNNQMVCNSTSPPSDDQIERSFSQSAEQTATISPVAVVTEIVVTSTKTAKPTKQPARAQSVDPAITKTADTPVSQSSVIKTNDPPVCQSAEPPSNQSASQSAMQLASVPVIELPVRQLLDPSINQSVPQMSSQSVSQSIKPRKGKVTIWTLKTDFNRLFKHSVNLIIDQSLNEMSNQSIDELCSIVCTCDQSITQSNNQLCHGVLPWSVAISQCLNQLSILNDQSIHVSGQSTIGQAAARVIRLVSECLLNKAKDRLVNETNDQSVDQSASQSHFAARFYDKLVAHIQSGKPTTNHSVTFIHLTPYIHSLSPPMEVSHDQSSDQSMKLSVKQILIDCLVSGRIHQSIIDSAALVAPETFSQSVNQFDQSESLLTQTLRFVVSHAWTSINQSNNQSMNHSINRLLEPELSQLHAVGHKYMFDQSINRLIEVINQSTAQSGNQSNDRPLNQSIRLLFTCMGFPLSYYCVKNRLVDCLIDSSTDCLVERSATSVAHRLIDCLIICIEVGITQLITLVGDQSIHQSINHSNVQTFQTAIVSLIEMVDSLMISQSMNQVNCYAAAAIERLISRTNNQNINQTNYPLLHQSINQTIKQFKGNLSDDDQQLLVQFNQSINQSLT